MNPWIVAGAVVGLLYLAGRRERRRSGPPEGGPESAPHVIAAGADSLFFELRDALGAPVPGSSEHEALWAGTRGGPAIPFGN